LEITKQRNKSEHGERMKKIKKAQMQKNQKLAQKRAEYEKTRRGKKPTFRLKQLMDSRDS